MATRPLETISTYKETSSHSVAILSRYTWRWRITPSGDTAKTTVANRAHVTWPDTRRTIRKTSTVVATVTSSISTRAVSIAVPKVKNPPIREAHAPIWNHPNGGWS